MTQAGGYRFDLEDKEVLIAEALPDQLLQSAISSSWEIPRVIDLRKYLPRRSQLSEGSCQGHAQTWASEGVHFLKSGTFKRFSPDAAYYWAQSFDGIKGDRGSTIRGGARVAKDIGSLEEQHMPYTPKYNPQDIPDNAKALAAPFRIASYSVLRTYREIVEWYARGIGMAWWGVRWGWRQDRTGMITAFSPSNGGHAVGIGTWGREGEEMPFDNDGLPSWLWQTNSWTNSPQEESINGFCPINRKAVEQALKDPYTVCVGVTDMEQISPRTIDFSKVENSPWR